jgi:hypothetical protein
LLFTFVPGGINEFFSQISQTPPEGWAELGLQYDSWIVGEPLSIEAPSPNAAVYPPKQND